MAFSSTEEIARPLIGITGMSIALMLVLMLSRLRSEGRQSLIRLVSTGRPPALTLVAGENWHLFLSA
jgi:hypothetical protein